MPYKKLYLKHIIILVLLLNLSYQDTHAQTQTISEEKVFEDDFKSHYSGRKYNYEGKKVIKNTADKPNGEFSKYENDSNPDIKEDSSQDVFSLDGNLSWLFIVILISAVIFLAFTLLNDGTTGWFNIKRNTSLTDYQTFNVQTAQPDDFITLINSAENDNNYRLAIRYYFLFILKTMSNKSIIKLEEDKTNTEYLREIKNKSFANQFSNALYLYNYTWYGEFDLNKLQYKAAKSNFKSFLKKLKR
ncbi:MAG: hypothetical protein HKO92_02130 [Flavobacteriaceae bacterium]|nr:hypothetical protein [Flavobacteriaceae bacterium]